MNDVEKPISKGVVILRQTFMFLVLVFLAGCTVEQRLADKLSCDGSDDPEGWRGYDTQPFDPELFFCETGEPIDGKPVMVCYAYWRDKVAVAEYLYEGEVPIISSSASNTRKIYSFLRVSVGGVSRGSIEPVDLVEVVACD